MADVTWVEVEAKQKLNFGKFQGELLYIAKGEKKRIPLTPTVNHYAEVGLLKIVGEVKKTESKPESFTHVDNELPKKKENVSKKTGGK